jgi:uncharacterized protein YecE (DUF72 family)
MPSARTLERIISKAGTDFTFSIKAHRSMTHDFGDDVSAITKRYKEGIRPLVESGKLSAVLLQFPYSFHYTAKNRLYLARLCDGLAGLPLFIEFRNNEWQKQSVYNEMEHKGLNAVITDMPALPKLPSPDPVITGENAYIRFHGRNKDSWWEGNNVRRYDYLYAENELAEWLPKIKILSAQSRLLIIAFNNHYKGKAVRNARQLQGMLDL